MGMTLVVTRNVAWRVRGFLASCMCEVAPGVFTGPRMTAAVRERIWRVLNEWHNEGPADAAVLMTWPDAKRPGGQAVLTLGSPRNELYEHDGIFLVRAELTKASRRSLKTEETSM